MPIIPASKEPKKWFICYSYTVDGEVRFIKEEFHGTVREAMLHEIWLRGLVNDVANTGYKALHSVTLPQPGSEVTGHS